MINKKLIPVVPKSGSLGASGDLAQLSRVGCAMMGVPTVMIKYNNQTMPANDALHLARIEKFEPLSKEGLALTNGTNFMASILAINYLKENKIIENLLLTTSLFLDSIFAVDAAFHACIS
jgi:histidine ammonia-lyase